MVFASLEFKGEALESARTALGMIKTKAMTTLGQDFEVRDLRPEDLTFTNPTFDSSQTSTTAGTITLVNNGTIGNNRWIAIYGISYPETSPLFSSIKITAGGALKMDRNIEGVAQSQNKVQYFDPVLAEQNTSLLIQAYKKETTTNATETLAFLGVVAEKKGQVLAP